MHRTAAYFLEPFLLRGIVVDAGGAYLLPRLVGLQRAKELAFLGDKLPAADAKDLGLVNRVAPPEELDAVADELRRPRLASRADDRALAHEAALQPVARR